MALVRIAIIVVSLVSVITANFSRNDEGKIRDYLLNRANYSPRDRPVMNSRDSIHVSIGLSPYAMLNLNERDQLITVASWLTTRWRDERLTWNPEEFNNTDLVVMYVDEIWTPSVVLSNSLSIDGSAIASSPRHAVLVTSDGNAVIGEHLIQSTHCPISVRFFPFDWQECPFKFFPGNLLDEHLIITSEVTPSPQPVETSEWDLIAIACHDSFWQIPNYVNNRPLSNYTFTITCLYLQRHPTYYIYTLIVPSTVLCILSMISFLAPPDSGERISLGVSIVLGLTVFQLIVADTLPSSSKEGSLLSGYLNANFFLACLVVPISVININIAYGDIVISRWTTRNTFLQNLFLEYFPRILKAPTLRERIASQKDEVRARETFTGNNQDDDRKPEPDVMGAPTAVVPFDDDDSVKTETLSNSEKIKLQTRTFSVVMDRLIFIVYLVVFAIMAFVTMYSYTKNPGVNFNSCSNFRH